MQSRQVLFGSGSTGHFFEYEPDQPCEDKPSGVTLWVGELE
jgi:hypothetical protein